MIKREEQTTSVSICKRIKKRRPDEYKKEFQRKKNVTIKGKIQRDRQIKCTKYRVIIKDWQY